MPVAWSSSIRSAVSRCSFRPPVPSDRTITVSPHPPAIAALGYVAASLTTVSFIPQALKTIRSGDTRGISLRMYALFTAGIALWGVYGLLTGDGPLIAANAITLVTAGLIFERKLRAVLAGRR
jgi:MtN3 and saliva related transmembrane protein